VIKKRQLYTVSGAAHRLLKAESTIRRWSNTGRLPIAQRLADGTRLFREVDLIASSTWRKPR